jgi:hypothetical protein
VTYILGLDVGQAADFTALCVLEREARPSGRREGKSEEYDDHYTVAHLERPPLRTAYPEVVRSVQKTLAHPRLAGEPNELVVDATGVGRPVVDMLREAGLDPRPCTITGGAQTTVTDDGFWHVPKRVLVSSMSIALQTGRLHVVKSLPLADVLMREMLAFRVKVKSTQHESYEAWREGDHDDLVLAVAMAVWWGERNPQGGWRADPGEDMKERRRLALLDKQETPWWRQRKPVDRGRWSR